MGKYRPSPSNPANSAKSVSKFAGDYRLPPYLTYDLVDELDSDLAPTRDDGRFITTLQKVLTSLRVLGSGSFQYAASSSPATA